MKRVKNERKGREDGSARQQDTDISHRASRADLIRRDEAEKDGYQCPDQPNNSHQPHSNNTAWDLEWPSDVGLAIAQPDRRDVHDQIHQQVDDCGHLTEELIGRLYRWQNGKSDAQDGDKPALQQENRNRYAV